MEEIKEVANIVRFLTKQNINHDMQNEILEYHHNLKNRRRFTKVYLEGTDYYYIDNETEKYGIGGLWHMFKYLKTQSKLIKSKYKIVNIGPEIVVVSDRKNGFASYFTKSMRLSLDTKGEITNDEFPMDLLLNKPGTKFAIKWQYIEI